MENNSVGLVFECTIKWFFWSRAALIKGAHYPTALGCVVATVYGEEAYVSFRSRRITARCSAAVSGTSVWRVISRATFTAAAAAGVARVGAHRDEAAALEPVDHAPGGGGVEIDQAPELVLEMLADTNWWRTARRSL
jgi:hypothetical protein